MTSHAVHRSVPWIAAAVLALLCGSAPAQGPTALMVAAIPGAPTPNPAVPQGQVTCSLSATVYNAPTASYTQQIQGPFWSWGVESVQYSPTMGGQPQPAPQGQANVLIDQPDGGAPDAALNATFTQVGSYTIAATVTCSYTDFPATDVWTGSAPATLWVSVYAPSPTPTLTLVANQYAVCAGGQNDSLHQAILTATYTDGQGNPIPNVTVDFSKSDGSLPPTPSGTTDINGQATTTLTSSQNASDSGGQWLATVTASLDSDAGVYATAQVEFQPPTMSLTAAPGALAAGAAAQLSLALTWNGLPVNGHAIGWRIARIWDVNQQLIYNDTGNPPPGYIALVGPPQSASPSNQQGQAFQSAQAGSTPGRVEVGATDQSVLGAYTQTNPGQAVQMAAGTKVLLKSLQFTSDHAKLCDGGDIITAGKRYPKPEWTAGGGNYPITQTADADQQISIIVTLTVAAGVFPANSACTLTGTSTELALGFTGPGNPSAGDNAISLTAGIPITNKIRKINASITWSLTVAGQTIPLGDTGAHVIYTTLGVPNDSGPDGSTVPNPSRMEIVVPAVSAAVTAAAGQNYTNTNAGLVWQLNPTGEYYLGRSLFGHPKYSKKGTVECWYLTQVSTAAGATAYDTNAATGADCISIAVWLKNIGMVTGLQGTFQMNKYMAYYVTVAAPKRPEVSVVGSLGQNGVLYITPFNGNNTYGLGVSTVGGIHNDWYLALADRHCLKGGTTPPAAGTVGTGPGGINNFEAAVVYTDPAGKNWYFPGGTPHCYSDVNKVVQIFQTLAWLDNNFIVQAVDYTYGFPANGPPDDKP